MVVFKKVDLVDIDKHFLDLFDRSETVQKAWRYIEGAKVLMDVSYTEHWDQTELEIESMKLHETALNGGVVIAGYDEGKIVAFAAIEPERFGSEKQYHQLSQCHVSSQFRGKGIGKALFNRIINESKNMGVHKLYISASSCETTQAYYSAMGCTDAIEHCEKLVHLEPFDIQLEYDVKSSS